MKTLVLLLTALTFAAQARASEEDHAVWSSVQIEALTMSRAGSIAVSAKANHERVLKLAMVAFGKSYDLPEQELKKLAGFPLSGIVITHGPGYEVLGGYFVNLRLRKVAYDSDKNLIDQTAFITVSEKNGLAPVVVRDTK